MNPRLIVVVLLVACTSAYASVESDLATIYATTAASPQLKHDGELARRVAIVVQKQAKALIAQLHPWDRDPTALLLTTGASNEAGIRPNAHTAFGLAVLYRCTGDTNARDKAMATLRFLLPTHGAGDVKCADGKPWHNQWQSAYWAYSAGKAAWLLWDDLDAHQKWLAAHMVCDEADRFTDQKPPMQIDRDTKAEENAWNSTIVALAFNMFPRHPRHDIWRETAIRWQINSFVTARDTASDEILDGKPLRKWLVGANLFDDYTLENHDRVHPDYMGTIRIVLHQKLIYDWANNPPPQAIEFNATKIYANLKKLALPDGNFVYPNGQDWQIHRNADWMDLHTAMAQRFDDPQAARLMRISLDAAEKMLARDADSGMLRSDEVLVPASHSIMLELYADVLLYLRAYGEGPPPIDEAQLWRGLAGTHVFEAGKFAVVRTEHSVATFSWGRQVMGMVLPLRKDLLLTPNVRGLIGIVGRDTPVVRDLKISRPAGGFAACGILDRDGKKIEQRFAFVALPDGRTIYADSLPPGTSIQRTPLGVLNDVNWVYHDGRRTIRLDFGEHVFRAADAANSPTEVAIPSPWCNLDGLGIVRLQPVRPAVYQPKPSPIKARLEQLFVLNSGVTVFYPDQSWEQTRDAASRCKLQSENDPHRISVILDDGERIEIDLQELRVKTDARPTSGRAGGCENRVFPPIPADNSPLRA